MISELLIDKNDNMPCPRCGATGAVGIGQSCVHGELRWYESTKCKQCGLHSEADGFGFPPEEIRNWLIKNEGTWLVKIDDVKSTVNAAKVLRRALLIDVKMALSLLRSESKVIYSGTKGESLWLQKLLEESGELVFLLRK